jgi:CheY-like chemotaxis protein
MFQWPDPLAPKPAGTVIDRGVALVVDDNRSITMLLVRLLSAEGFTTHHASSALDGLAQARNLSRLDLVVTDVRLPGNGGVAFVLELEMQFPEIDVLFISGEPDEAVDRLTDEGAKRRFLLKPFTTAQFLAATRTFSSA